MNRELAVIILKDILDDYKDNELSKDQEALRYAIKELERTAPEVPVQEQYVTLKIDSKEIARVVIDELRKQQKQPNRVLII